MPSSILVCRCCSRLGVVGCTCDICRYRIAVDRPAGTSALLHLACSYAVIDGIRCKLWSRLLFRTISGWNAPSTQHLVASLTASRLSRPRMRRGNPLMQQTQMRGLKKIQPWRHGELRTFPALHIAISKLRIAQHACASNPLDVSSRSSPLQRTAGCRSPHHRKALDAQF